MVPNGWVNTTIGKLGSDKKPAVKAGPFGSALKKEFYTESGYKIYGQEQVISNDPFYGNYYIDENRFNSLKSCAVSPGDILLSLVGTIGKVLLLPENCEKGIINPRLLRLSLDAKIVFNLFFKYFLEFDQTAKKLHRKAQGGTMGVINAESIKSLPILLPPIQEQQKIAKILSTWDKAIANTENLIANSEMQKKALMQQLLTGKKRLLDENGVRFSGEWKRTQLKTFLTESTLRNKNSNIDRVLSITNHSGFVLPEEQFSKRVASNNVENYKIVTNGQFGYNPSRLNVGSFGRLDQYKDGILSPMYVIFNVDTSKVHSDYFLFWMGSGEANQRIKNSTQGSVRESVGFDALCAIPFSLPSISEQEKIAAVLSNADHEIKLLQAKLEHLKQEKKALMQQLLTGKRRVVIN